MEYRRLGSSGLQVSALSLGSWITFGGQIDMVTARELLAYAYDQGVNFFDNAEVYANGQSEKVMGEILQKMGYDRSSYIVSSKAFFGDGGKQPTQVGLHRKHLIEACHAALQRLQVDYLDLYFCHRPDPHTPIEEVVETMNILIQQGKILYRGTSMWPASAIEEAYTIATDRHLIGPTMEQPQYNMFFREKIEQEYTNLYAQGLGTTIRSPLAGGLLTGKYNRDVLEEGSRYMRQGGYDKSITDRFFKKEKLPLVAELQKISDDLGCTMAQLALARCLKYPHVSTVILGASKLAQLEENIQALAIVPLLDEGVMKRIDKILG